MATLRDKCFVVSGASSGIGRATAEALLAEGAQVVGLARTTSALEELRGSSEGRFFPVAVDLTDREARGRAVADIAERHPRLDAIVNNAGETSYESPLNISIEAWAQLFELNLLASVELVQGLRTRLIEGGHVVNVCSVTASGQQSPRFASYGITKLALSRFTDALRMELAPAGYRVTEITPGLVDTPIYRKVAHFEAMEAKLRKWIPEWLAPEDVARAILWALEQPAHVAIGNITIFPTRQAQ